MVLKKDSAYYSLGKVDRILALSGVPTVYLTKPIEPNFSFQTVSSSDVQRPLIVHAQTQHLFFHQLCEQVLSLGSNGLYLFGSYPTEQPVYEIATFMTKKYFSMELTQKQFPSIKWINLGRPDWSFLKSDEETDFAVIHNLTENSDQRRLDMARDFIHRCSQSTTLVLTASSNILDFSFRKLNVSPYGFFQLNKTMHRTVV